MKNSALLAILLAIAYKFIGKYPPTKIISNKLYHIIIFFIIYYHIKKRKI